MNPPTKDDKIFLTATKTKTYPKHPKPLDNDPEGYLKSKLEKSIVKSTGFDYTENKGINKSLNQAKKDNDTWNHKIAKVKNDLHKRALKSEKELELLEIERKESLLKHKYDKLKQKVSVSSIRGQYDKYPIKPGFLFFDCLIKSPKMSVKKLKQNIPESLYFTDRLYFLCTENNGQVQCTIDIFGYKYMQIIESQRYESHDIFGSIAVIMRGRDDDIQDMQKILLDWNQFKNKMIANETMPGRLVQRYIKAPGGRPAVTRLHYFSHTKDNKANFAYFIKSLYLNPEINETNIQKCVVDMSKPDTLEVFKISGSALKCFENEAENLVSFLNKAYNVRIQEIILDYLRDSNGIVWLCGCKSIKIDEKTLPCCFNPLDEWSPDIQYHNYEEDEEKQKQLDEMKKGIISFVHCKLCRLYYSNGELSHLVSVRMLMLYKVHVTQRMDLPWDTSHLKLTTADILSQSVRICQFCYLLVTSEFELIKVEDKMAEALNVPKVTLGYEEDPKLAIQLQFLPKNLVQWRILFHAVRLYDTENFTNTQNLKLSFNFVGHKTTFPIKWQTDEYYTEKSVKCGFTRMHYMFLPQDKTLKEFIMSNCLDLNISSGDNIIAHSRGNSLGEMPHNLPLGFAMYQQNQIILFNSKSKPMCNLALIIGFSCDKLIPSKKIKVMLTKHQHIYIPQSNFMTADPLPKEWMELFGQDTLEDNSIYGPKLDEEVLYSSHLTKEDLKKMEDMVSPYSSFSKISTVRSVRETQTSKSKDTKIFSFDEKLEKSATYKPKKKSLHNIKIEIPENDLGSDIQPIYSTVSRYLTSRPVSSKTIHILEKAPLHSDAKVKERTSLGNQSKKSRLSSRRSRVSTNYDSSSRLSITSSMSTKLAQLERQRSIISVYTSPKSDSKIPKTKSLGHIDFKSRLKIKKKFEKKVGPEGSVDLGDKGKTAEDANVDKEKSETIETIET